MKPSALCVFYTVLGPSGVTVAVAAALLAFAVYLARADPAGFEQTIGIALFLQLFAASTGYRDRLRHGHFDPLLVGDPYVWSIGLAHWLISAGPGFVLWGMLGAIELAARPGQAAAPFTLAGLSTFLYASTIVWTVSLPFQRYAAAVLWLIVLFALAATQQLQSLRVAFTPMPDTWIDVLRSTAAGLVFPVFLMLDPAVLSLRIVGLMLLATVFVWMAGVAMIRRFEAALVLS
jgi:hypothetical protein